MSARFERWVGWMQAATGCGDSPLKKLHLFSVVVAVFLVGGVLPSVASAARVHQLLVNETLPQEARPLAAAVNQTTGHIYVAGEVISDSSRHIYNFDENAQLDPIKPELTGANPSFAPQSLAV